MTSCSENSVWLGSSKYISSFKFTTSRVDKYWPRAAVLSSFKSWQFLTSSDLLHSNGTKRQRKLQHFLNRSFDSLEPLRAGATTLAALRVQAFSLGNAKLLCFVPTEWNAAVITKLPKWQVDKIMSCLNDKLAKWLAKWHADQMTSWQNDMLTKWQVGKMTC